jgi:hypothetical protein
MAKQPIFKTKYVQKLKAGLNEAFYKSNEFVYDKNQVYVYPNIEQTEGLVDKLDVNDDCKTAIAIYEAFENLEPIQASDERLWVYLAHADLYPYMVKRWNAVQSGTAKDAKGYILDHWFLSSSSQGNLMRHAISGLWWSVFLSIDKDRDDKYELTRVLFKNQTFRTRTFGNYRLVRHKEAAIGLLEFCLENKKSFSNFEKQHQILTEHLNRIGGIKLISYYDRNFFKSELEKVSDSISAI